MASPTYTGYIDSVHDALLVIEACLRDVLKPCRRRLQAGKETKRLIKSGNVFTYSSSSQIRRWTDSHAWSASRTLKASRILRGFIQYRELERPPLKRSTSTTGLYLKDGGLIKKTIRIDVGDINYHIISYYAIEDIDNGTFKSPSNDPIFRDMYPRVALLRNFPSLYEEVDPVPNGSDNAELEARQQIVLPRPIQTRTDFHGHSGHRGFRQNGKAGYSGLYQYSLFETGVTGGLGQEFISNIGSDSRFLKDLLLR
jgi:hypothetical protein